MADLTSIMHVDGSDAKKLSRSFLGFQLEYCFSLDSRDGWQDDSTGCRPWSGGPVAPSRGETNRRSQR